MLKKKVQYVMTVDFWADNEAGLEHAIKSFPTDPAEECTGCNIDHGVYSWKQGRIFMASKGRTVHVRNDGDHER